MKILALLIGATLAQSAFAWETPEAAMSEFLKFEMQGGRVKNEALSRFMAEGEKYKDPAWEKVEMVQGAKIDSIECGDTECTAKVVFDLLPTRSKQHPKVISHPDGGQLEVAYTLSRSKGQYLLKDTGGTPKLNLVGFSRLMASTAKPSS